MSEIIKLGETVESHLFNSEPFICELHGIANEGQHVSIACNLARFVRFLKIDCEFYDAMYENDETEESELFREHATQNVLFKMYLIVERIELVFKAIYYPPEYKNKEYPVLSRITRWANFLKHPRTSFFAHVCDNVNADTVKINEILVQNLWSGESKAGQTRTMLAGKQIEITYPSSSDFQKMIVDLSTVLKCLIQIINENPKYKKIISDDAVLELLLEECLNESN